MRAFGVFIFVLACVSVMAIIAGFFIESYDQRMEALMAMALFSFIVLVVLIYFNLKQNWKSLT